MTATLEHPYPNGTRVRALIGVPARHGTVTRNWWPYRQYQVLWDPSPDGYRGYTSNIDADSVSVQATP